MSVFASSNKLGHFFAIDVEYADFIDLLGYRETRATGELASPHDMTFHDDLRKAGS